MKFKLKLQPLVYGLLTAVMIISLAAVVINILIMAEVGRFVSTNSTIPIISLICSILTFLFSMSIAVFSCYAISAEKFIVRYGLIPSSIPFKNILAIVEELPSKRITIQFKPIKQRSDDDFGFLVISINPTNTDDFIKCLLDKNPDIKHNKFDITQNNSSTKDNN